MAYEHSRCFGNLLAGIVRYDSVLTCRLDSRGVVGTSGRIFCVGFYARQGQSSAALTAYAYVQAVQGTPAHLRCALYPSKTATYGDTPDTGAGPIAVSSDVDASGAAGHWVSFALSGVTLTVGEHYWLTFYNDDSDAANHWAELVCRGSSGGWTHYAEFHLFESGVSTNGFSTTMTRQYRIAPVILVYADGTATGSPFVKAETAGDTMGAVTHDRGLRLGFSEDVVVSSLAAYRWGFASCRIYDPGGDELLAVPFSYHGQYYSGVVFFPEPFRFEGGRAYDLVFRPTPGGNGNGLVSGLGEASPPPAVLSAMPRGGGVAWSYIHGATPGAYTVDPTRCFVMGLVVDDNPAVPVLAGGAIHRGMQV